MASETRCTITVDEKHDPPRWLRMDGLRLFEWFSHAGSKAIIAMCIVLFALILFATVFAPSWFSALPWWRALLVSCLLGLIFGLAMMLHRQEMRRADIRYFRDMPDEKMTIHHHAIIAAFYKQDRMRTRWFRWLDADAFRKVYQSQGSAPPSVIMYGATCNADSSDNTELPLRITGDSSMRLRSKWVKNWMKIIWWALLLFSAVSLASLLTSSNRATVSGQALFSISTTFLMSLFFTYQLSFAASRKYVQIDRSRIGFSKWFRRRTLSRDNALCVVTSMFGMVTLQWHQPDRAWPAHTLYFHDPNDPRLATILNLWTADPLPDN